MIHFISELVFLTIGFVGIALFQHSGNYFLLIGGAGLALVIMVSWEEQLYNYIKKRMHGA